MTAAIDETISLAAEKILDYEVSSLPVALPTEDDSRNPVESNDSESCHVRERTSDHLRSNQMKVVEARSLIKDLHLVYASHQSRESVLEIVLYNGSLEGKPGIVLSRTNGTTLLIVDTIREGGWFKQTALTTGMAILSINGVPMAGRTPLKVITSLRLAQNAGRLVLMAGHFSSRSLPNTPVLKELKGERRHTSNIVSTLTSTVQQTPSIVSTLTSTVQATEKAPEESPTCTPPNTETGRYSRVEALVYKHSPDEMVGITFMRKGKASPLLIKSICDKGLFASSMLCSGMVVLKVNDMDSMWFSPKEAVAEIRNAKAGKVSVKAEGYYGSAHISNFDDQLGISFENVSGREGVFIGGIDPSGQFSSSYLRVGMQVILINGNTCPINAKDAIQFLAKSLGDVDVLGTFSFQEGDQFTTNELIEQLREGDEEVTLQKLAHRRKSRALSTKTPTQMPRGTRSPFVHVILQKELQKPKPGILLSRKNGHLVVKEIRNDGWFSNTALKPGMEILAIDNEFMSQKDTEYIFEHFQQAKKEGRMLVTARSGESAPVKSYSRVESIVHKKSANAILGISFTRKGEKSPLIIKQMYGTGLFADSMLQRGMVVLKINDSNASWFSPNEAAAAIRNAPIGHASVTAEGYYASAHCIKQSEGYGLVVKNSSTKEGLFIFAIKENSPFALSALKPGMQLILINGEPCPSNLKAACQALRKSADKISILATFASEEGDNMTIDDLTETRDSLSLDQLCDCFVSDCK
jgi:C-terminal processing protease CtpA/Prc